MMPIDTQMEGRMLWVCRHGHRADELDADWAATAANPDDPPLSPLGLRQADATGLHLRDAPIDAVFAAPFRRALQTANGIVQHTGHRIRVEHGLCEILRATVYAQAPALPDNASLHAEFPAVDPAYRCAVRSEWPEDEDQLRGRVSRTVQALLAGHKGNLLLVGHAFSGRNLLASLGLEIGPFALCGLVCARFEQGAWHPVGEGVEVNHLAALEPEHAT